MIIRFLIIFLIAIFYSTTLQVQAKNKANDDYEQFLKDMLAKIEAKSSEKSQPDTDTNQQKSEYINEYKDIRNILFNEGNVSKE